MTIINATIMFTNEETEMISECAKRRGLSFQEFVRQSALEKVEDALDKQAFENAIAMDDGQHYNTRQVMRMAIMEPQRKSRAGRLFVRGHLRRGGCR